MLLGKKVVLVLPACNAEKTLERTVRGVSPGTVDEVILVDDASHDQTSDVAASLGVTSVRHAENRGHGGNQKTCYRLAVDHEADVVVMLHPDRQYSQRLVPALPWLVGSGDYEVALGSRILGGGTIRGGMPVYKYMLSQILRAGFRIGAISCPASYSSEPSSINFRRSVVFGPGVCSESLAYRFRAGTPPGS